MANHELAIGMLQSVVDQLENGLAVATKDACNHDSCNETRATLRGDLAEIKTTITFLQGGMIDE